MSIPTVAIIGRPNVGKSSLLNALAGKMISIVEPTAGVTRDRISTIIEQKDRYFELVDTGGYGIVDSLQLSSHIEQQITQAIDSADLVLFLVDIRDGITPLDEQICQLLRKSDLDIIGVANKADSAKIFHMAAEFSKLGLGEFMCISATNNLNKNVLLDKIFNKLRSLESSKPTKPAMKIAIIGKRNTGKSTLLNSIVGENRVIVSERPGTTRDAVDVRFEKDGKTIVIIDTAGVRKKRKIQDSIEFYGYVRATRSIHRADAVLLIIDSTVPISQVDKKLSKIIATEHKACIIIINKWDLAKETHLTGEYEEYITKVLPGLKYAPIAFTTANQSKNIQSVLDLAAELHKQATTQIPTAKLNKAFEAIRAKRFSPSKKTKKGRFKIYYATQIATNPLTILMFVNDPKLFEEKHRKYIINKLREMLGIEEVPIRLVARSHRK
ncbi:MAG: ribosome biogenesis GTPase Der [Planctomycetota bacterium]